MKTVAEHTNRSCTVMAWCLSVLFVVGVVGCSKEAPSDANGAGPSVAAESPTSLEMPAELPAATPDAGSTLPPAPAPSPDAVVVSVNGEEITEGRVAKAVEVYMKRAGAQLSSLPANIKEQFEKQTRQRVVDSLVSETLLDQQVKAANIVVTDDQVIAAIDAQGAKQSPPVTVEQLKGIVSAQGGSFDELLARYKMNMARQQYLEAQWAGKIDVNDAMAQTYYDENSKEFESAEQVRASHILIKPEAADANDPNAVKAAAKAETEKLLAQLKDGADFAELAKAHSDCPSASKGGDLGLFGRGQMVPPFEQAAFALQPGEMSD
ncbi:MAG: peptidylprolyl isomerase, partial [Phycisphaerales bacterium]